MKTFSLALLIAACLPATCSAALSNCPDIALPGTYKIVVDDFTLVGATAAPSADLQRALDRLRFSLDGQTDALERTARQLHRTLNVSLQIVSCTGRQPTMSEQDFTTGSTSTLNDFGVVVETWGRVTFDPADSGPPRARARVGFVVPPVRHYLKTEGLSGIKFILYPRASQSGLADDLKSLPELTAFALAGLAVKASKARDYDTAALAYTQAIASLTTAMRRDPDSDLYDLLAYLQRAACRLRNEARSDGQYRGTLKFADPETCSGASS